MSINNITISVLGSFGFVIIVFLMEHIVWKCLKMNTPYDAAATTTVGRAIISVAPFEDKPDDDHGAAK